MKINKKRTLEPERHTMNASMHPQTPPQTNPPTTSQKKHTSASAMKPLYTAVCFLLAAFLIWRAVLTANILTEKSVPEESQLQNPLLAGNQDLNDIIVKEIFASEIHEDISSYAALLYNVTENHPICQKNENAVIFPASLTKIMTAILAVESIPDMKNTEIEVKEETITRLKAKNASMAGFSGGETLRALDLLYGCLLSSGADASVTLAEYVAGSEQAYVERMNDKAKELGMNSTNFINVTGLHDVNHYTTCSDLIKLFSYALQNATFRTAVTTARYYIAPTEQHPNGLTLYSTVQSAFSKANVDMGYILGGKTGYTPEAKLCLATLCIKGESEYILVVTGAGDGTNRVYDHVFDTITIYQNYT